METRHTSYRIVADSAADLFSLNQVAFSAAPLKVITDVREYRDTETLDVEDMVQQLKVYKGKSTSSCPNPEEWLAAFGDAEQVLGVTLTSGISGSYNAAQAAKNLYEAQYPNRRVFLVDSLSAGPGETILVEKLEELILSGLDYEQICKEIVAYQKKTGLLFILQSLTNFANNGRVSVSTAKLAGLLGICVVGKASEEGTLQPTHKCRGLKKSIDTLVEQLQESGFQNGRVRIAHCFNESGAIELKERILQTFPDSDIRIYPTGGLCSFYAEEGGLLVGYDTVPALK